MKSLLLKCVFTIILCYSASLFSQTYTSVQDGSWDTLATWDANGIPPRNLINDTVNINHDVTVDNVSVNVRNNGILNVNANGILDTFGMDVEIFDANAVVNISNGGNILMRSGQFIINDGTLNLTMGILVVDNGAISNNSGVVNFDFGRMSTCNGTITDFSNGGSDGFFGIGTIYSTNATIEDVNTGNWSLDLVWCTQFLANGINLPTPRNCAVAAPAPGEDCLGIEVELFTCRLLSMVDIDGDGITDVCDLDDDNDGILDVVEGSDPNGDDDTSDAINSDGDSIPDFQDIDSDNDGIPDNIEAQSTVGYSIPSETDSDGNGLDDAYEISPGSGEGLTPENTDSDGIPDYLDNDSDNDSIRDIQENGDSNNNLSNNDTDGDGLDNNFDSNNSTYDPNDEVSTGTQVQLATVFGDENNNIASGGDLDYRDFYDPCTDASGIDSDGDGINDPCDLDDDNDGIPNNLDGCATTDITNTIGIGNNLTNSSYILDGTSITYNQSISEPDGCYIF